MRGLGNTRPERERHRPHIRRFRPSKTITRLPYSITTPLSASDENRNPIDHIRKIDAEPIEEELQRCFDSRIRYGRLPIVGHKLEGQLDQLFGGYVTPPPTPVDMVGDPRGNGRSSYQANMVFVDGNGDDAKKRELAIRHIRCSLQSESSVNRILRNNLFGDRLR